MDRRTDGQTDRTMPIVSPPQKGVATKNRIKCATGARAEFYIFDYKLTKMLKILID